MSFRAGRFHPWQSAGRKYRGPFLEKSRWLFGRISRDILFVSLEWRRLQARNLAIILILIPVTTYEKTSYTESAGRSFKNGF